jgi:hypothetical protein
MYRYDMANAPLHEHARHKEKMASTGNAAWAHLENDRLTASALFNVDKIVAVVTGGGTGIAHMLYPARASPR